MFVKRLHNSCFSFGVSIQIFCRVNFYTIKSDSVSSSLLYHNSSPSPAVVRLSFWFLFCDCIVNNHYNGSLNNLQLYLIIVIGCPSNLSGHLAVRNLSYHGEGLSNQTRSKPSCRLKKRPCLLGMS